MLVRFVSGGDGILILAVVSTILCFISVFSYATAEGGAASGGGGAVDTSTTGGYDDYVTIAESDSFFYGSTLASLIVSIPSAFDTLLDVVVPRVIHYFFDESEVPIPKAASKLDSLFYFTVVEKTLFVIGMMAPATLTFPSVQNYSDPTVVYTAFGNCATILTVCSILSLLSRISFACSPAKAFFVALLVCLSCILYSFVQARFLVTSPAVEQMAFQLSSFLMIAAAASFVLIFIVSGVSYFYESYRSVSTVTPFESKYVSQRISAADDSNSATAKRKAFEARYRFLIVAAHVQILMILFGILCPWYWHDFSYSVPTYVFGIFNYVNTACGVLIYVTEARVRKLEASTALVSTIYACFINCQLTTTHDPIKHIFCLCNVPDLVSYQTFPVLTSNHHVER
jgi:hypothetical protein